MRGTETEGADVLKCHSSPANPWEPPRSAGTASSPGKRHQRDFQGSPALSSPAENALPSTFLPFPCSLTSTLLSRCQPQRLSRANLALPDCSWKPRAREKEKCTGKGIFSWRFLPVHLVLGCRSQKMCQLTMRTNKTRSKAQIFCF